MLLVQKRQIKKNSICEYAKPPGRHNILTLSLVMYRTFTSKVAFLFVFVCISAGCDPWFAYSPYEAQVADAYLNTTVKNLELINAMDRNDGAPFKVALLSDPHYHYGKLADAVRHINAQGVYSFAIVAGDLTENGLKQEFVYFHETMTDLTMPYLTVIGNHDYLSNGEVVYGQMYGDNNYSFVFNNVKFVLFDNNTIESGKEPDIEWLAEELVNDKGYDHVIPFSHVPPYDQQMKHHYSKFHDLLVRNNIPLSIHGHRHEWSKEDVFGDGISYLTVSSPQKRTYTELTLTPAGVEVKKIEY